MEVAFLACFLLIFCSKSLISLGFQDFPTSNYEDLNLSEPKFGGFLHGVNVTTRVYVESNRRGLEGKHDIVVSKRGAAKGRGADGGGNNAHHPRANKSSASLTSVCFYLTTVVFNVSLAALMALFLLGVF